MSEIPPISTIWSTYCQDIDDLSTNSFRNEIELTPLQNVAADPRIYPAFDSGSDSGSLDDMNESGDFAQLNEAYVDTGHSETFEEVAIDLR